jgi:2,3,4,5-tetrahydropyridine-2-carboxylate N-succinyltransferase
MRYHQHEQIFFNGRKSDMQELIDIIEKGWDQKSRGDIIRGNRELEAAVQKAIMWLDKGRARVAEKTDDGWQVNQWLKKAVLLSFHLHDSEVIAGSASNYFDKVPLKYAGYEHAEFEAAGVRVVPDARVRQGAYIAPDVVLMPSYVNIGAYVDSGTMVDTWVTVGTCAQIGKNVHLSGGVGIGGVLEPIQAGPTIIEDDCFIGARSEIVEGVIVEKGSVISMGVFIGQSTKIYNRQTGEVSYGRVPAGSVVVSGSLPAADGSHSLYCAVIVKQVDAKTRAKTALNDLLRLGD